MTTFGVAEDELPKGIYSFNAPGVAQDEQAIQTRGEKLAGLVTFGAPSVVAGFFDTLGQTVGMLDDNDMINALSYMSQSWGDFYSRNREAAQTVGDLTGMFIPGMAGVKLIRGGSWLANAIQGTTKSKLLGSVFTSGKKWDSIQSRLNAAHLYTARRQAVAGQVNFVDSKLKSVIKSQKVTKRIIRERMTDSIKEALAFEATVATTMNESDTLYPDEFSVVDHVVFNGLPIAAFTGIERFMLSRAIRHSRLFANNVVRKEHEGGISFADMVSRPGQRGDMATMQATKIIELENAMAAITNQDTLSVLNSAILSAKHELRNQIQLAARDNPLGGFKGIRGTKVTNSVKLADDSAELRTLETAVARDNSTLIGLISVEHIPETFTEIQRVVNHKQKALENLDAELNVWRANLAGDPDNAIAIKEITKLQEYRGEIAGLEYFVLEANGDMALAITRKPIYQDGSRKIRTQRETKLEPRTFVAEVGADPTTGGKVSVIGVTEDLIALLPQVKSKTQTISGVNVTKIVPTLDELKSPENFKLLLKDMGQDWHYKHGARGKEVFQQLPPELRNAISDWTGVSSSSELRQWGKDNDPRLTIIYDAYSGMRNRLRELADTDGTIPLVRGESRAETKAPKNDIVSMTSSPEIAKMFAGGPKCYCSSCSGQRCDYDCRW